MLGKEVREALETELEHLKLRKRQVAERIDARIRAIEAVLSPSDDFGQQPLPLGRPDNGDGGPLAGKGLREAMRTVLQSYPGGLKPSELTARLEQLGFRAGGTLPLKTRVWSEIGRLKKEKRITKRGKKVAWSGSKDHGPQNLGGGEPPA